MPTNAHSTMRTALDPWLGAERSVCIVHSRRVERSSVAEALASVPTYHWSTVRVGRSTPDELETTRADLVVIDASTGDFDAVRLCRDVRASAGIPIITVATAEQLADDAFVIDLLDAGAADVVRAGISTERLLAHLRAALRASPPRMTPANLVVGDVVIDLDAHVLSIADHVVNCPPLLFSMLAALASTPNKVTTREALLANVWGVEPGSVDTRRVRVAASLLRRVLGVGPRRPRLETVARIGYRLAVD